MVYVLVPSHFSCVRLCATLCTVTLQRNWITLASHPFCYSDSQHGYFPKIFPALILHDLVTINFSSQGIGTEEAFLGSSGWAALLKML